MKKKEDKILIKEIESLLLKSKENNTTASVIVKLLNRKLNSIAEEQEKFKILSNNLPGIAYLCKNDKNYSIIFVNKAVKKLTGYSASDFIKGKNQHDPGKGSDLRKARRAPCASVLFL